MKIRLLDSLSALCPLLMVLACEGDPSPGDATSSNPPGSTETVAPHDSTTAGGVAPTPTPNDMTDSDVGEGTSTPDNSMPTIPAQPSEAPAGSDTSDGNTHTFTNGGLTAEDAGQGTLPDSGGTEGAELSPRARLALNDGWRFQKDDPPGTTGLSYAAAKAWVLPTGNAFLSEAARRTERPAENLGDGVAYVSANFDDSSWRSVDLPHDYAIEGPYTDAISSSMGRLPSIGVAWYRKMLRVPATDEGKAFFIDIDGAMSYSMVWVNGQFVGGWPYGYASYRVDISKHVKPGEENTVAIRVDNPVPANASWDSGSSRWYPGAGIYRNVWLVTTDPIHVAQYGTHLTTPEVTEAAATVSLAVTIDNRSEQPAAVEVATDVYELDAQGARGGQPVATLPAVRLTIPAGSSATADTSGSLPQPKLWGPPPTQTPHRYVAITRVRHDDVVKDVYETPFGVRTLEFDPDQGLIINGEPVKINGVCLHHDLGPLGAAFNYRARERQLEIMAEMGSNAIRTSHNPFEPEFVELADRLGFLVVNEVFDVWEEGKAALDHHVFFNDWHEQDLRAFIRRDRNHPSVIMWSIGNELVEQHDNTAGPAWAERLTTISHSEDPTRPTTAGMNAAEPDNPFSVPIDTIGLNYQGTGVRDRGAQYPTYHEAFPDKFVFGSETTSTFSTRGVYLFPVTDSRGEPAVGSSGIDTANGWVSSYDLYHADWSSPPDDEFESQDKWAFVGGEFVWTGFDYLGEPTPLDSVANSSYFGIVDLAGLRKDRFYLYQAYWRPDFAMVHLLPHWTWPDRVGQVTPVHVYTSGDSAELFLNGMSLGRKSKTGYEYRLRWDDVVYEPGELAVVAYKDGMQWATDVVETAGAATKLALRADRTTIAADGKDLSFVTVTVVDSDDRLVPQAAHAIQFTVTGPGELVATASGDPTNRTIYSSPQRNTLSGKAIAIVRGNRGESGDLVLTATSPSLTEARVTITTR